MCKSIYGSDYYLIDSQENTYSGIFFFAYRPLLFDKRDDIMAIE